MHVFLEMRQRGRFAGFRIFASITGEINGSLLCYGNASQLPPLNFTTTCTATGRYIIYYNDRVGGVTYPEGYEVSESFPTELCEVIVKGIYFYFFIRVKVCLIVYTCTRMLFLNFCRFTSLCKKVIYK